MTSCSGPVPSKNALRALRSLAFGTPGLVVGAVGGVCALAGVQYEIRRKTQLAQDIIDTKRTLASFASGRGKDRVRQMLEAAEKGDDFLMDRHRSRQRRQRRDHSTTTVALARDDDDAVLMLRAAGSLGSRANLRNPSNPHEPILLVERDAAVANTTPSSSPQPYLYKRKELQAKRSTDVQGRAPKSRVQPFNSTTSPRPFTNHASRPISIVQGPSGNESSAVPSSNNSMSSSHDRPHQSSTPGRSWERLYTKDLENSSAERIRLATIQTMKPANQPVYSRQSRTCSAHSPVPASLDLAPKQDETRTIPPATGEDQPAEDFILPADTSGSTFSRWPALGEKSEDTEVPVVPGQAHGDSPEADSLPPNSDISEIFTSSFITVEQEQPSNAVTPSTNGANRARGSKDGLAPYLQYSAPPEENMDAEQYRWWLESYRLEADGFRGWMKALRSMRVLQSNTASLERSILAVAGLRESELRSEHSSSTDTQKDQAEKGQAEPCHSKGQVVGLDQPHFSRYHRLEPFVVPPPFPTCPELTHLVDGLADLDYERYTNLCADIGYYPSRLKRELALSSRIEELVSTGNPDDIKLAELLFHTLFKPLQGSLPFRRIPMPAIQLAARLLEDGHFQRAAVLLFPYDDRDLSALNDSSRETKARMLYGSAHDFLAWLGRSTHELDKLDQVARLTIEAATIRGIHLANLPIGYLLAPVIRSFCSRGHEERAHELLKDTQDRYGIAFSDTLDARTKLMIGYANSNRLVPLKTMLDECHASGASRQHPKWYSRTFQQVFQRHLRCNPLSESYDLLIHAMAYWGLMPTETVSAVFLSECLRYERYDFMREYVQAVRELYSFIDLGTGTSLLAWRFGRVWKDMQASCQQILQGCQAVAYCATDDPFGKPLRDVVEEASRLNITKSLLALLHASGQPAKVDNLFQLSFPEIIEWAQSLVSDSDSQAAAFLEAREELLTQLGALNSLNRLLGGHSPIEPPEHSPHINSTLTRRPSALPERDDGGYSLRIFQTPNILPDQDTLWKYLAMHYAYRQRKGLLADHGLLCRVCQELTRLQRSVEAAQLFAAVHESPYGSEAKGTPFDENVLQAWLDAATALDSPLVATKVMWAIIEANEDVFVSTLLLLQAEHACKRISDQVIAKRQARNPSSFQEETAYLQLALRRRFERQSGIKAHEERLMWNKYKSWDESTVDVPVDQDQEFDYAPFGGNGHAIEPATEVAMPIHAC